MGSSCSVVTPTGSEKELKVRQIYAEQEEAHRAIEKELAMERKKKILKLLLLGPGDSGKSTTLKQIRIIHDQGFTDDEKRQRKYIVYLNLISGMMDVINGVSVLSLHYERASSEELIRKVTKYYEEVKNSDAAELTEVVADAIGKLLEEPAVQTVLQQCAELYIEESSKHFLQSLERIRQPDYLPSLEDILKSRVSTSGVIQFTFLIKNFTFKVFDVGGQKAQRRKWIHIFDDVHAVLFITSLAEYNQTLAEDNKIAIKLGRPKEEIYFYRQLLLCGPQEYRPALDYITRKFKQQNKNSKRTIYTHETCATDTTQIEVVIDSVIDVVIQQTMQKVGIQ